MCSGHDHTHGMAKKSLRLAFLLTILILLAGIAGGLLSHSLALLSDAAHTLTDLFALGLAWFAAVQAERPANERNTFGYHRVGILSALINAVTLILVAVGIAWEAIQRIQHPEPVQPGIMFVTACIAIAINLYIGFGLRKEQGHNLNMHAATLHVFGDVAASVGVIVAGLIISLTNWTLIDPLLSVAIALYIAYGAWGIVQETTNILLEATPSNIALAPLVEDMKSVQGVVAVHDLHVWRIASGMTTLSCHVSIDEVTAAVNARILNELNSVLEQKYQISHATLQLECRVHSAGCCTNKLLYCQLEQLHEHNHDHDHDEAHTHSLH